MSTIWTALEVIALVAFIGFVLGFSLSFFLDDGCIDSKDDPL